MPSICFVAGDPSGDTHAARLVETLKARPPGPPVTTAARPGSHEGRSVETGGPWTFTGLGGPAMQRAGVTLLDDLTKAAAIGPFDAARHLQRFLKAKRLLDHHLTRQRPDLVILVDFGDFNLPFIAPLVKRHRLPILYYISPQLWAWGRWRMRYVRRYVDRMVVFFPFETTLYQREGVPVTWVGHPLVDEARPSVTAEEARGRFGLNPWRRTVGLLPGSREQEIRRHLPLMLSAARQIAWHMPGVQFLLPKAAAASTEMIQACLSRVPVDVRVVDGSVYDALQLMEGALVASGTATLQAAICNVPMVVVYRTSWPTYLAARLVVRVPHIAMVNLVAGRRLVPELIQHRASPKRIAAALIELLRNDEQCRATQAGLREVTTKLGPPGAVQRAASVVLEMVGRQPSAISPQQTRSADS